MRARTLALPVAALAALALAPVATPRTRSGHARPTHRHGPAQRLPRWFVGMWSNELNDYACGPAATPRYGRQLAGMENAGVGLVRRPFDVRCPTASADRLVLAAARHRIRILPVLLDLRRFSDRARHGARPPRRVGRFAARAAALVRRYGPHGTLWADHPTLRPYAVRAWQVWNEPNLPVWWRPRPNPRAYVRLLRATSKAIHRTERRAVVVSAGLPDSRQSRPYSYAAYLDRFLRAGGRRWVQAVGAQAYSPTIGGMLAVLRTYRAVLRKHGARRFPLWVTEFGWADRGPRNPFVVGARGQARRIGTAFRLLIHRRHRFHLLGVAYYQWVDTRTHGKDSWGLHTGLFRRHGHPKPALSAFIHAIAGLL